MADKQFAEQARPLALVIVDQDLEQIGRVDVPTQYLWRSNLTISPSLGALVRPDAVE